MSEPVPGETTSDHPGAPYLERNLGNGDHLLPSPTHSSGRLDSLPRTDRQQDQAVYYITLEKVADLVKRHSGDIDKIYFTVPASGWIPFVTFNVSQRLADDVALWQGSRTPPSLSDQDCGSSAHTNSSSRYAEISMMC